MRVGAAWRGLLVVVLLAAVGCGQGRGGVRVGRVTAPDGLEIAFDDRGAGETTLVFVHCWACDRAYWREQVDVFADRYRVVSLDLGGHGESGTDRDAWSLEQLGGDVAVVVDHLGLERLILVGHSMGGPVSLYAAQHLPGRVLGIVAVDTLHNADQEFPREMVELMAAGFEVDFAGAMEGAVRGMSGADADPALTDWVVERACAADPDAAIGLMRAFASYDMGEEMREAGVPIRAINAEAGSQFQPVTEVDVNRQYGDFDAVIMEDVGHFLHLQEPADFNARLAEAIAALETAAGDD